MSVKKQAVLIINPSDLEFLEKQFSPADTRFVAHEFHTIQLLPEKRLEYFYEPSSNSSKEFEEIVFLGLNWHRDKHGRDLLFNKGISVGPVFIRRVKSTFANIFRNYKALKQWLSKTDVIYISVNEAPSFLRITKIFGERIKIYDPGHREEHVYTSSPERTLALEFPAIHKLSGIARLVQKPFLPIARKRKHLYFTDWTSKECAKQHPEILIKDKLIPWEGYYFRLDSYFVKEAESIFPERLDERYTGIENLSSVLSRINVCWDNELLRLFSESLQEEYNENRNLYVRTHAIYNELFTYYKPSVVSIPGECSFFYVIAAQVAKNVGIKTFLIVDGYPFKKEPSLFYKDATGKDILFTKIAAFGEASKDLYVSTGIDKEKCILMRPPVLKKYQKNSFDKKQYDAIVMHLLPNQHNPQARWDFQFKMTLDAVKVLLKLGKKGIAIKVKAGAFKSAQEEPIQMYRKLLNREKLLDIDILGGQFYECILKADIIVGGISTGVAEAVYNDIPFYIYEPYENGTTDDLISDSRVFSMARIARTPEELEQLIMEQKSSVLASKEYLFDGPELSQVALNDIMNN